VPARGQTESTAEHNGHFLCEEEIVWQETGGYEQLITYMMLDSIIEPFTLHSVLCCDTDKL
jgi:hypothetical protein